MLNMDEFEWNVATEGQLLEAMIGHKPVGINKYFQMAFICDKFVENCKEITSEKVWKHLEAMYNLEALDESEKIPFPNSEKDFLLPDTDFGQLLSKKEEEEKKPTQKGRETPKLKEVKKEDKTPVRGSASSKETHTQRRDSKDTKEKPPASAKKEIKKDTEKGKGKGKTSSNTPKDDKKSKAEETPKPAKRPLRGSLKPDDSSSSGKSSPVTVTPAKRRRI